MRIVFMGTPAFALPSLEGLIRLPDHQVVGVVTQPDRPQGRGLHPAPSPVKRAAAAHGLPVLQPERLRDGAFLAALHAWHADLFVVVAFRILPVPVLSLPPRGAVNLHASLLPKYRGAAPIQWAIINGEQETGVTTFVIDRHVDTGGILLQRRVAIGPEETAGELHDRLAVIGAKVLAETVEALAAGRVRPVPQSGEATAAPKLSKQDGRVDWAWPAGVIHNRIRGLNPYPMAFTTWRGRTVRLVRSAPVTAREGPDRRPGDLIAADENTGVIVQTGKGWLKLVVVQPEGRKQMSAAAFVRGYRPEPGERLGVEQTVPVGEER
jgi:methionyl-tRNA formyltransferase